MTKRGRLRLRLLLGLSLGLEREGWLLIRGKDKGLNTVRLAVNVRFARSVICRIRAWRSGVRVW